ncbi:GGDEF domain-containing protein [Paucibacter sp. O1-1]|nr:GGDEF domain-containing protein [Paucibacter sp. O1-1]MDA3830987.1 GGDEF domain-containing protein [Paucibacter sp. O1-1]
MQNKSLNANLLRMYQAPKAKELKELVDAFNSMSAQLKQVLAHSTKKYQPYTKNLVDQVSGLPNRQYIVSRINGWLSEPSTGALYLVKMDWLEDVHSKYGFQVRDETIAILSEKLQQHQDEIAHSVIARIAAYEFAFLVEDGCEHDQLTKYLQKPHPHRQ